MDAVVTMTGNDLDGVAVASIARSGRRVLIDPAAGERIAASAAAMASAAARGVAIYGVTTGLGPRVVEAVDAEEAEAYAVRTVRGRATAVGPPLAAEVVRAAMAARLNGLCRGGSGAGLGLAEGLAGLLNCSVHPCVPRSASVGASDLCLMAHVGLTLIGEGEAELHGERMDSAQALARAGLSPVSLGLRDGLAICSSSAITAGAGALALVDAEDCLACAQVAAALAMEGFRANLSPLDPRVVEARPAPGQAWASAGLRTLLAGGALTEPGAARRLQDPLSLRCASQIHGSLRTTLIGLQAAVAPELNGEGDNPLVLDGSDIVSTGNFHTPALAVALDAAAIAVAQVAAAAAERQARLKNSWLSGLPPYLAPPGTTRSGMGLLSKTAQALALEIRHAAAPLSIHPMVAGDGVEDDTTGAAQAALRLRDQLERLRLLIALELVVAAQAVALAAPERLGAGTAEAQAVVRELVAPLEEDRPLGPDVERVAERALGSGELLARVRAALG